jgi:NADP-dependent 3-hydroxy acid dehydrogenase YdfG
MTLDASPRYTTALVTGGSSGIGEAVVRTLSGRGLVVHAVARRGDRLQALAAQTGCIPHAMDVTDASAIADAFATLPIDVLVHCAGATLIQPLQAYGADDVDRILDLNLRSVLQLSRIALPGMLERDRGHVVVVGSMAGHYPMPGSAIYSTAKAGISHAFDVLRLDTLGSRVRWSEIAPGRVATEAFLHSTGDPKKAEQFLSKETLSPQDVADSITHAITAPAHVNISRIELHPVKQASGGFSYAD